MQLVIRSTDSGPITYIFLFIIIIIAKTVVVDSAEVGSPSISESTANGIHQVAVVQDV